MQQRHIQFKTDAKCQVTVLTLSSSLFYIRCSKWPPFARTQAVTRRHSRTPLIYRFVYDVLSNAVPHTQQALTQLVDVIYAFFVDPLFHYSPDLVIHGVHIWAVWGQLRSGEMKSGVSWRKSAIVSVLNWIWRCCISTHLTFQVSQGSAETDLRWGENFIKFLFHNSLLNIVVKKLWKSVNICQSCQKNKSVSFFMDHSVVVVIVVVVVKS